VRIVSLLPSATEIVYALGLGDQLEGRTFECDYPPEAQQKPIVSSSGLPENLPLGEIDDAVRAATAGETPLYRLDEARIAFEKMLTYANHLGLYSEEIGPTGEALGNFPQAFTHLSLISAATNLDRQLG